MTAPAAPSRFSFWLPPRGALLAVAAMICVGVVLYYSGPQWPAAVERLLLDAPMAAGWLLSAWGIGWGLDLALGRIRRASSQTDPSRAPLRQLTRIALGLGVLGLATLLLGLAGVLSAAWAWAMLGVGLAATAAAILPRAAGASIEPWLRRPVEMGWLWLICAVVGGIALTAALVPPGIMWGDEPHGYDVLSYHLQLPREWFELGRIEPLEHNVYSYFPLGVEMHYLLAMHLRGGPWEAMYLAQFMHLSMAGLAVAAVYAAVRAAGAGAQRATLAAVAAASVPWMPMLGSVAYNEGGLLLYGTLAIGWAVVAIRRPAASIGPMLAGGLMAGLACGVKLTAIPMLLVAVPVVFLGVCAGMRALGRSAGLAAVGFVLAGTVALSPWLVRNQVWAGNPVFPQAQASLGHGHFSDVQVERWQRAHSPRADQRPFQARLSALSEQTVLNWRYGWVLLPLSLVAAVLAMRSRRSEMLLLLGVLGVMTLIWLMATHLQARFLVLAVPVAAIALGISQKLRAVSVVVIVASTAASCVVLHGRLSDTLDRIRPVLGRTDMEWAMPEDLRHVEDDRAVVLVGDSAAFRYALPMNQLRYRTVFDVDAGPEGDALAAWVAGAPGDASLWIVPSELRRLSQTYQPIATPPAAILERPEPFMVERRANRQANR